MSNFNESLQYVLKKEGGYVNDPNDNGGETYKGVARNVWPKWDGWRYVDVKDWAGADSCIESFYRDNFWVPCKLDYIENNEIATSIFDFAVNTGVKTSVMLAQKAVGVDHDGVIGNKTISAINDADPYDFMAAFALVKIARYISICKRNPSQKKYFYGWVCRTLNV